ncbi:MAG: HAMP domain-containing protein [Candidatus Omnitrophica bacterium]|nr:HAMP domain-containing protein [Candidatus Omnitrophota bacterium]
MPTLEKTNRIPITTKFILSFLFIAILPLIISTYISYKSSREALRKEVSRSLLAIADNKINQIEAYLNAKRDAVEGLSYDADIIDILKKFTVAYNNGGIESEEYNKVMAEYKAFLSYTQRSLGHTDLMLVSTDGNIVFSANKTELRSLYEIALYDKNSKFAQAFIMAKESSQIQMSDFQYNPQRGKAFIFIAAPISFSGNFLGAIVVEMDNKGLSALTLDYKGLGDTGEASIAFKEKDLAVFITPLRFDSQAAFKRKIVMGAQEGRDIQRAVGGESGSGYAIDYRGKNVLATWKYLPSFRLGITAKIDVQEVFTAATRLRNTLVEFSLLLFVMVLAIALFMAHSIANPIKELTRVSSVIAGGDLSARATITTQDEIGDLADSFNLMTGNLIEAKASVEQEREKLKEQKKLLEKANQELDSFVYTVSHDLRAPLRGVTAFAKFLEEDYLDKLDAQGKENLREIIKGTSRMNILIEDLLTLSRISRIQNPYEEVDIRGLIDSIIERVKFDIKEMKVELNIQEGLPSVRCDRIKMSEVFLNLINNAIKFSSKNNKSHPRVEIGYADTGEFHQFFVRDNGIGIDPQYHQQVFGIFKRLNSSEEYQGTGVGLSIVQRVADDHGGKVWIESELGKGATFYFTIPKVLPEKPA